MGHGLSEHQATEQNGPTVFNEPCTRFWPQTKLRNEYIRGPGTPEGCLGSHISLAVFKKASAEERERGLRSSSQRGIPRGGTTPGKASQGLHLPGVLGKLAAIDKFTQAI